METKNVYKHYDGTTDVRKFITKVELEASLKNHDGEKKAQYMASKLVGHVMDVYMRMPDEEKKDPAKVKAELLKEFERGQLNREEAIAELDTRRRLPKESVENFAFKVIELIKLGYPTFAENVRQSLAKDYFVRGLSKELQLAIKSLQDYDTMDVKGITKEAVRLEIAGVSAPSAPTSVASAEPQSCDDMVDKIAEKVIEKLAGTNLSPKPVSVDSSEMNAVDNRTGFGQRGRGRGRGRGGRGFNAARNQPPKKCRCCKRSDHLIRDCPERFCQACGRRGHDQYSTECPNHQP